MDLNLKRNLEMFLKHTKYFLINNKENYMIYVFKLKKNLSQVKHLKTQK